MEQAEVRKWRLHVWIILPSSLNIKDGKFPEKLQTIDIFPEMKLYDNEIVIRLRKNINTNRQRSNYLLESKVSAKSGTEAIFILGQRMERLLDNLAFQLQNPIPITYIEAVDYSRPLTMGEEREFAFANSYPRVQKDSRFTFVANWHVSINTDLIKLELDENVEASLRWFSKGIASNPIVDQFTSFWIALEIITSPSLPNKKVFFQCRKCGHEISSCPECDCSTLHYPDAKERLESALKNQGYSEETFEDLWAARMIFHGRNKLTEEEISRLPDMTWKLRMILVEILKKKLGIPEKESPLLVLSGPTMMDPFIVNGHRKLTETDLKYAEAEQ